MSIVDFSKMVIFEKGTPVFVVSARMEGYVISPLCDEDGIYYLSIRLQNKQVALFRFPEDTVNNIYPRALYQELLHIRELELSRKKARFIKNQYCENKKYSRVPKLSCSYSFKYKKYQSARAQKINKAKGFFRRFKYAIVVLFTVILIHGFVEYGGMLFNEIPSLGTGSRTLIHFSSKMVYNHSVGHSWTKRVLINGHRISHSAYIYLNPGDDIVIQIEFRERDNVDDIGRKKIEYTVTAEDIEQGFTFPYEIEVYENRGQYSGAGCLWKGAVRFF